MIKLTESQIDVAVARTAPGLSKYLWLQENLHSCDVSRDATFQRRYNGFYRVRRNEEWRSFYFRLMEDSKETGSDFGQALRAIWQATGRFEASFSSKLVASLDPSVPVVDRVVLENFGLSLPYGYVADRERKILQMYSELNARYEALLASHLGLLIRSKFTAKHPHADITDLKKVDLVLWQHRP